MSRIFLIWAVQGEYSARNEWPVLACRREDKAKATAERLNELYRALCVIFAEREDELEEAGDWSGETLYETSKEGRSFVKLSGGDKPRLTTDPVCGCGVDYRYCAVQLIEAGK